MEKCCFDLKKKKEYLTALCLCPWASDAAGKQLSQPHDRWFGPGTFVSFHPDYSRRRPQGSQARPHHRSEAQSPVERCGGLHQDW